MTDTAADIWYGTILKKETAPNAGTYADFGLEITNATAPGISRSALDATHMQSPDGYTEMIYGLKTTKPFTVQFNLVPAGLVDLQTAIEAGKVNWQIVFPDSSNVVFAAGITDLDVAGGGPDGKMSGSFQLTPSGKATYSAS